MGPTFGLKKILLYALIISVILSAVLGVALLFRNNWGWFELRERAELLMPTDQRNLVVLDEEIDRLRKRIINWEKLRAEILGEAE